MGYKRFSHLFLYILCFLYYSAPALILAAPLDEAHEKILLGSGPQSFKANYFFEKTGKPQGGIILTHGGNHHHIAENLGYILSQHGWSVLVFQEPEEEDDAVALRVATQYMEVERGLFNLVLVSSGSAWKNVNRFLLQYQENTESINGLVLLNAKQTINLKDLSPTLAILDIVTGKLPTISFQNRKIHADRYKLKKYQQLKLHLPPFYTAYGEDKLTRRIRGWLFHNVRGMEIGKNS